MSQYLELSKLQIANCGQQAVHLRLAQAPIAVQTQAAQMIAQAATQAVKKMIQCDGPTRSKKQIMARNCCSTADKGLTGTITPDTLFQTEGYRVDQGEVLSDMKTLLLTRVTAGMVTTTCLALETERTVLSQKGLNTLRGQILLVIRANVLPARLAYLITIKHMAERTPTLTQRWPAGNRHHLGTGGMVTMSHQMVGMCVKTAGRDPISSTGQTHKVQTTPAVAMVVVAQLQVDSHDACQETVL